MYSRFKITDAFRSLRIIQIKSQRQNQQTSNNTYLILGFQRGTTNRLQRCIFRREILV